MSSEIKVLAADFGTGTGYFRLGEFWIAPHHVPEVELEAVELLNSENVRHLSGMAGWGAAGALALGPLGAVAGLALGGRQTERTFVATFTGGRKLAGTCNTKCFDRMVQQAMNNPQLKDTQPHKPRKRIPNTKLEAAAALVCILLLFAAWAIWTH